MHGSPLRLCNALRSASMQIHHLFSLHFHAEQYRSGVCSSKSYDQSRSCRQFHLRTDTRLNNNQEMLWKLHYIVSLVQVGATFRGTLVYWLFLESIELLECARSFKCLSALVRQLRRKIIEITWTSVTLSRQKYWSRYHRLPVRLGDSIALN